MIINIPEWQWVKVATTNNGLITRLTTPVNYYYTTKKAGDTSPITPTVGVLPDEAIKLFEQSKYAEIKNSIYLDIYIMCANHDEDNNETGKIEVKI